MRYFDRFASVEFRDPLGVGFEVNPIRGVSPSSATGVGGRQITIGFEVERSIERVGNTARVQIYNLAESRRERVADLVPLTNDWATPTAFVDRRLGVGGPGPEASAVAAGVGYLKLFAGYKGAPLQIFEGDVSYGVNERAGPTWTTTLEAIDGGLALNRGQADRVFSEGTPLVEVVRYLVETCMNLRPSIPLVAGSPLLPGKLGTATVAGKAVLQGPAAQWLDRLAAGFRTRDATTGGVSSAGFGWYIDDGELVILGPDGVLPDPPVVVDRYTGGLLAEPRRMSKNTVELPLRLNGRIRPGVRVSLTSRAVTGVFRCDRVRHFGTNKAGPFATVATLRNLDFLATL